MVERYVHLADLSIPSACQSAVPELTRADAAGGAEVEPI
jgi:hypothetical protein